MAVLVNGKQVILRKGLPCGEPMRFVAGCSKVGASFVIVAPRKVCVCVERGGEGGRGDRDRQRQRQMQGGKYGAGAL